MRISRAGKLALVGGTLGVIVLLSVLWWNGPDLPPVGTFDPVCEQVMHERAPDLVFTKTGVAGGGSAPEEVSFGELSLYNGQVVTLVGFFQADRGPHDNTGLHASREDVLRQLGSRPHLNQRTLAAVPVLVEDVLPWERYWHTQPSLDSRCARITGAFRRHGPFSPVVGDLTATRLEVWSEPHRPIRPEEYRRAPASSSTDR